uniref:G8 domain-containing protein n=1 Tax=Esox lucius TaxID=8010 RepID=A0AAY5KHD6_ESOLU
MCVCTCLYRYKCVCICSCLFVCLSILFSLSPIICFDLSPFLFFSPSLPLPLSLHSLFPLDPELQPWMPGHSEAHRVTIGYGRKVLLTSSATVHSIEITSGGKLVIADSHHPILLRTKHILIGNGGQLHIGSPDCPYKGNLTISLFGRWDTEHSYFGRKYIGVGTGGTLEIHGKKKLSWTFLNKTLHPGESQDNSYLFERGWGNRGIIVHVIHPKTGEVLHSDRFDTYRSKEESRRLAKYVDGVENGMILAMVVNDEGSNNLEESAKKTISKLGSRHFHRLGFRYVSRVLTHDPSFISIERLSNSTVLELAEPAEGWGPGDTVVLASTDYSMHQAEEFTLLHCPTCRPTQVKVQGKPAFLHMGEEVDGVDMRAEVGLLSRNILIRGEMDPSCYGNEACKFFSFDTFGGHLKVEHGFKAVHVSSVELQHMGQQSMGHYPVHFHMNGDVDQKGGYDPPTSVSDLSIHHTFSRCVTIHGTNGLLVKDVVGYDALGHCFFTEDGPEERNTFDHCLGLMIRAGTLLPSDRDSKMCRDITHGAFPGYVANPRQDCSATSTFWIANPNNNLINCAAAGSEETGFWFLFHHVPTGPSEGMYSPGRTEHTPMGLFTNNRAHSNYRAGMILDNGVKTTQANDKDKRPFLSLVGARYGPHQDADPFKPRVPALIHHFVAYKNQDHGAWLRGGDVWLDDCQFADNGIGLTLASGGTFPDDDGSRQEVKNSLFVGESENRGMSIPDNRIWGPGGSDLSGRTLPRGVDFPIRGMQIYDGPINVQNCTFRKYIALDGRHTSAFGFRLNNSWQSCPKNNVTNITFHDITSRVFFGEPGPWFNQMQMDGDKTTIFHDVDGSVSEYPGAFLVKQDNWLLRHPDCIDVPDWRAAICSGRYAQIYIQTRNPANLNMQIVKDEFPDRPLELEGALGKRKHYQQFQPVITLAKGYTIHWDQAAPAEIIVWLINFDRNDWINVGFCYPAGTTFTVISDIHNRFDQRSAVLWIVRGWFGIQDKSRLCRLLTCRLPVSLLFLQVKAYNDKEDFAFCSVKGCERVKITAVIPKGSPPSNCMAQAYPRHAEMPIVDVPMPSKLPGTKLVRTELGLFLTVCQNDDGTDYLCICWCLQCVHSNSLKCYRYSNVKKDKYCTFINLCSVVVDRLNKFATVGHLRCFTPSFAFYLFSPSVSLLSLLQRTSEHFLEVKLESYNTRFFHINEDFAYTEVGGWVGGCVCACKLCEFCLCLGA